MSDMQSNVIKKLFRLQLVLFPPLIVMVLLYEQRNEHNFEPESFLRPKKLII